MNTKDQVLNLADYNILQNVVQTKQIQEVFNEADRLGGVTVVFPKGTYVTGTINIKSASVYLEKGSVWRGSDDFLDYYDNGFKHNEMGKTISMIYSMDQNNISITGSGTIDMRGDSFFDQMDLAVPNENDCYTKEQMEEFPRKIHDRPSQPIFFYNCKNVVMDGITICDAPCWTISFNCCEDIRLTYLNIKNKPNLPNNDGMHFCGCRNVVIHGCNIVSGDDCIALSSISDWDKPCENFVVSDCIMSSSSKTIVLGYSHSIVRNVTISNCVIYDSHRGICIMAIPGTGLVEHVLIENVRIETRVRAGNWWGNGEAIVVMGVGHERPLYVGTQPGRRFDISIRDISFRNISCLSENAIAVIGEEDSVSDIYFDGIYFEKKESKNLYIKGERRIDVSPSENVYEFPEEGVYWFYESGCKNVSVRNSTIKPWHGIEPQMFSVVKSNTVGE